MIDLSSFCAKVNIKTIIALKVKSGYLNWISQNPAPIIVWEWNVWLNERNERQKYSDRQNGFFLAVVKLVKNNKNTKKEETYLR